MLSIHTNQCNEQKQKAKKKKSIKVEGEPCWICNFNSTDFLRNGFQEQLRWFNTGKQPKPNTA